MTNKIDNHLPKLWELYPNATFKSLLDKYGVVVNG